jgi:hypothetical protein
MLQTALTFNALWIMSNLLYHEKSQGVIVSTRWLFNTALSIQGEVNLSPAS